MLKYLEVKRSSGSETDQSEGSEAAGSYSLEELKTKMEAAQKKHFGYKNLKGFQIEAVHAVFHKRDSLIVMATGMGKSLCYQIPSLMEEAKNKFTMVISPLISLMTDQVDNLNRKRISSIFLGSGQKISKDQVLTQVKHGMYKIVYCSPEYALNNKQLFLMLRRRILLVAIDEVHCMSEWGHDFRPSYRKLHELRDVLVGTPFMGLTATCTGEVQRDILKNLKFDLKKCLIKTSSVNKRNLFYCVREKTNLLNDLRDVLDIPSTKSLQRTKRFIDNSKICPYNSTLIYVNSKKECESIFSFLREKGLLVRMYHADLSNDEKKEAHEKFLKDEVQIIVATVAFGMGIDKPDIRRIVHYGFSRSLEAYVQQVGRAGRDNSNAEAILFFHINDESKIKNLLLRENIANNLIETNFQRVEHIISMFTEASDYAYSTICRRKKIYDYFDETPETCTDVDVFNCEDNCGVCFYVKKYDMYLCANCDNCAYYLGEIRGATKKMIRGTSIGGTNMGGINPLDVSAGPSKRQSRTDSTSLLKRDSRNGLTATLPRRNSTPHAVPTGQGIDLSTELKTLLSCISSLKGRTGVGVICKVLVKSKEASIIKKGYHNIKEYGDGAHKSTSWWSAFLKVARNDKYVKETLVYSKDVSYLSVGVTPKGEEFINASEQRYNVRLPFFLMDREKKEKPVKGAKKANGFRSANEPFDYTNEERASQRNRGGTFGTDFTHRERRNNLRREENQLEGEPLSPLLTATHRSSSHQAEGVYPIEKASVERNNTIPDNKYGYFNTDKNQCHREHQYREEKLTEEKINDSIMKILLRTRIIEARQQNIPPFQLISDKPLKDICHKRLNSVHLIRKHVDNISPVCPNSFLEKLISGIRGFCLLHDLDMNINLNTASQNVGSTEPVDRSMSSLNKFSNLISSFQYDHKGRKLGEDSSFQGAPSREIRSGPYPDGGIGNSLADSGIPQGGIPHGEVVHSGVTHGGATHKGITDAGVVRHCAHGEEETSSFRSRHFNGGDKTEMKMGISGNGTCHPHGERNHTTGELIGGVKPLLDCETNHPHSDAIEKNRRPKETTLSPFCTTADATSPLHHFSGNDKNRLMDFFDDDFKFVKEANQLAANQSKDNHLDANRDHLLVDRKKVRQAPLDLSNYTFQDGVCRGSHTAQPMQIPHEAAKPSERTICPNRIDTITRLSTPGEYANGGARTGPSAQESPPGDPFIETFHIRKTMGENHVDVLNDKKKKLDLIDSFSYDYKKKQDEDSLGGLHGGHDGASSFQDLKRRRF
ncbi:adenosinetriphosphatase [Plasmodium inui San Antonio 1]|uniref:DNA 3'-5' helicase n=1 Tax=Plasmodium inui San Antonio 1 TaxID=1237626 RepID=W7AM84_9APIC|nr:adenosinetriphosphatase [Plasmodium inui San Antonio 1]EUD66431.1 adenosinetriphosphatase [Plasmodium inui San Antonio 1]